MSVNTNATKRAIILGNLADGVRYWVQVATTNKKGVEPLTATKCVEVTEEFASSKICQL